MRERQRNRDNERHAPPLSAAEEQALLEAAQAQESPAACPPEKPADESGAAHDTPPPEIAADQKRLRNAAILLCPEHQTRLRAASTPGPFTWYRCPEPGCETAVKVARPTVASLLAERAAQDEQGERLAGR